MTRPLPPLCVLSVTARDRGRGCGWARKAGGGVGGIVPWAWRVRLESRCEEPPSGLRPRGRPRGCLAPSLRRLPSDHVRAPPLCAPTWLAPHCPLPQAHRRRAPPVPSGVRRSASPCVPVNPHPPAEGRGPLPGQGSVPSRGFRQETLLSPRGVLDAPAPPHLRARDAPRPPSLRPPLSQGGPSPGPVHRAPRSLVSRSPTRGP